MKTFLYGILTFVFSACCLTGNKCDPDQMMLNINIVNSNGDDLIFGASKMYDKNKIKFFSLNAGDTMFQNFTAGVHIVNSYILPDSILTVTFNDASRGPIFVKLTNSDVDTLNLNYQKFDGGRCCGEYKIVHAGDYNGKGVQENNGLSVLEK